MTYTEFVAELARVTGCPVTDIEGDDDLRDLGVDSIRLLALIARWNTQGITVNLADVAAHPSVSECAALIGARP